MRFVCGCVAAVLALSGFAGCNDGEDPEKDGAGATGATDPAPPARGRTEGADGRLQVRTVPADGSKASEFGSDGRLEGAGVVQLTLAPPESSATSSEATVRVARLTPDELEVTAQPRGGGRVEKSTVTLTEPGLKIDRVIYPCGLPSETFCPLRQVKKRGRGFVARTGDTRVPVSLTVSLAKTDAQVSLIEPGPEAPRGVVDASVRVRTLPSAERDEATPLGSATEAGAEDRVQIAVQPSPGSPKGGTLRIAVPRSTGRAIKVQAGGSEGTPASTATINAATGRIRVADLDYSCQIPPETFCPLNKVQRTPRGLLVELPTPRVPVTLILTIASA